MLSERKNSDQVDRDIDVAARGFRVRTYPLPSLGQCLGGLLLDTWQADVEANAQEVAVVSQVEVYFGVDRDVWGGSAISLCGGPQSQLHFRKRPTNRRRTVAPDWRLARTDPGGRESNV